MLYLKTYHTFFPRRGEKPQIWLALIEYHEHLYFILIKLIYFCLNNHHRIWIINSIPILPWGNQDWMLTLANCLWLTTTCHAPKLHVSAVLCCLPLEGVSVPQVPVSESIHVNYHGYVVRHEMYVVNSKNKGELREYEWHNIGWLTIEAENQTC